MNRTILVVLGALTGIANPARSSAQDIVERIAPADVDPAQSTASHVVPRQTCEAAGWGSTLGLIHSHPTGERCWYFFPGTSVPTSDGYSFLLGSYSVDAIMCGDRVVWVARNQPQQEITLTTRLASVDH